MLFSSTTTAIHGRNIFAPVGYGTVASITRVNIMTSTNAVLVNTHLRLFSGILLCKQHTDISKGLDLLLETSCVIMFEINVTVLIHCYASGPVTVFSIFKKCLLFLSMGHAKDYLNLNIVHLHFCIVVKHFIGLVLAMTI